MPLVPFPTGSSIHGTAAAPGIAIGKAQFLHTSRHEGSGILLDNEENLKEEMSRFEKAVQAAVAEVKSLLNDKIRLLTNEEIDLLESQIELITDPQLRQDVVEKIKNEKLNAHDATLQVIEQFVHAFRNMNSEYMRARAVDIQDAGNRIIQLLHPLLQTHQELPPGTILIADDLSPSDAIAMDLSRILGVVTRNGGKTSHTALLARVKHIPAVLGCGEAIYHIKSGDRLIIDGTSGTVIVHPNELQLEEYTLRQAGYLQQSNQLKSSGGIPAQTLDGLKINLLANISTPDELQESIAYHAEGIGLFRTEMLFMGRNSFPSEDDQFEFYKEIALNSSGKTIHIRTMDIGGDKPLTYFALPREENPFLGYRGIRISLDRKDLFITQLKAILRASALGRFKIMFPMISSVEEFRSAKEVLESAKLELKKKQIDFDPDIPVGLMIEVPSAAMTADILAKEADFFSIGTNDLCQYTLAVDRGNRNVTTQFTPFHPGVLRLIDYVIKQAHKHHIEVGMCGELAADPLATLLLIGMGLRDFSMNAASIPFIRQIIRDHRFEEAQTTYDKVMAMDNSETILQFLQTKR